jgi:hypothetical protein
MRKLLKLLHEIGAVGVVGSFAACLVLVAGTPEPTRSLVAYAAVRQDIAAISKWLLSFARIGPDQRLTRDSSQ